MVGGGGRSFIDSGSLLVSLVPVAAFFWLKGGGGGGVISTVQYTSEANTRSSVCGLDALALHLT